MNEPDPAAVRAACERLVDLIEQYDYPGPPGLEPEQYGERQCLIRLQLGQEAKAARRTLVAPAPPADARPAAGELIDALTRFADAEDRVGSCYPRPGLIRQAADELAHGRRRVAELAAERDGLKLAGSKGATLIAMLLAGDRIAEGDRGFAQRILADMDAALAEGRP